MKKINKKYILVIPIILLVMSVLFLRVIPLQSFSYQTSTRCNSNLFGGGDKKTSEYRMINGGLGKYDSLKSSLESLNIEQGGCGDQPGVAPQDYTTIYLYLL